MTVPKIILTTVLTTITALAFAVVFGATLLPAGAIAHGGWSSSGHGSAHFGSRRGGNLQDRCERLSEQHTRVAGAMVTAYLDLDDAQEAALQPMLDVLDSWRADGQSLCLELANQPNHSVDLGLSTMQAFLARSASAMAELQPAYAAFAGSLSTAQQAKIQAMLDRHHANDRG